MHSQEIEFLTDKGPSNSRVTSQAGNKGVLCWPKDTPRMCEDTPRHSQQRTHARTRTREHARTHMFQCSSSPLKACWGWEGARTYAHACARNANTFSGTPLVATGPRPTIHPGPFDTETRHHWTLGCGCRRCGEAAAMAAPGWAGCFSRLHCAL